MKKLFSIISGVVFLACSPNNSQYEINIEDKNDIDSIRSVQPKRIDTILNENKIDSSRLKRESYSLNKECAFIYDNASFPIILIVDELCGASTTYYFDEKSSSIKKNRVMPDCPSDDKCEGVFVVKTNNKISEDKQTEIQNTVDRVISENRGKREIYYLE